VTATEHVAGRPEASAEVTPGQAAVARVGGLAVALRITAHAGGSRAWNEARALALPPQLAATPLAQRPYDLRHSALSTWLAAGGDPADPAEVAQRAGNSVEILLTRYAKCLYDRQSLTNQRIEHLLSAYDIQALPGITAVDGKGDG
jgi:integrase